MPSPDPFQLLTAAWAKSTDPARRQVRVSLLAHLVIVGTVAEALLERDPDTSARLSRALKLSGDNARRFLAAMIALHDIGKLSPSFQAQSPDDAQALRALLPVRYTGEHIRHELLSMTILFETLRGLSWRKDAAALLVSAIGAHHGWVRSMDVAGEESSAGRGNATWADAQRRAALTFLQHLDVAVTSPAADLDALPFMTLAGLTVQADWIGSSVNAGGVEHLLKGGLRAAWDAFLPRARAELDRLRVLHPVALREPDSVGAAFDYLAPGTFKARPLQTVLAEVLAQSARARLVLIEAPMGEGKTEAALWAHLTSGNTRGLYVAMPTQATSNQMLGRAERFLQAHVTGSANLNLVHGGTALNTHLAELRERANLPGEHVAAGEWFTRSKRGLLTQFGVGTVDQALAGVLNGKFGPLRLFGLSGKTVVIDEAHAYDAYTGGLVKHLLRWLKDLDVTVVLMSATLPEERRTEYLTAFGVTPDARPTYPYVTVVDSAGVIRSRRFRAKRRKPVTIEHFRPSGMIDDSDGLTDIARCLIEETRDGGYVAAVVNTVERAQQLFMLVRAALERQYGPGAAAQALLFHARVAVEDRAVTEEEVLRVFGPDHKRRKGRRILIATQVVEQSLDLDFDFMVTDIAPVDLVLQRLGRVHRHVGRRRPRNLRQPRVRIYSPNHTLGPQPADQLAMPYLAGIDVLFLSWVALRQTARVSFPADVDRLVQMVYADPHRVTFAGSDRDVAAHEQKYTTWRLHADQERIKMRTLAMTHSVADPDRFEETSVAGEFQGDVEEMAARLATRLGEETVTAVLLHRSSAGLFLDAACTRPAPMSGPLSLDDARALTARSVRLGRAGLVQELKAAVVPAWEASGMTRMFRPLILDGGRREIGSTIVELCPLRGVVYHAVNARQEP
ncbi:CRISPR-associated helicase Cas3' [Deinococcus soli (ex Cha et al. 2016)]|uniref:CRISPR-associated endonuclease/helicase Cas3 n=2 Tax=Deinococcus soli (ex Cha et al. 2016) TaxID=1309411 RepID=A0AAE4BNC9_9DEIO|nr:CRISPR-associated helicase Cas3' [Deinococcus soli (ex Cha et al. 2016)]MDR6218989.1 CRISPR-associated endonuclease/helicase Cas3 [Deinococcus soli (ex Cha et al. 2016)]MDR6328786.1 CRISPR-associated endonuclease/helicase Cas3 [Deinococcus soli (ex Cha et al. 2016)]MDR6751727.1 CRISPR-associated endonuclease/helicase Cas3 [Deinococcus soli (ex Cha et al. 2016)]